MTRYLIDANLPNRVAAWQGNEFLCVSLIDDMMSDSEVWKYAKERGLTIVTKDSDFSHRIIVSSPPPRPDIVGLSNTHKLDNVFADHIEAFD